MDYATEEIGRQLRAARQAKGLSQRELSARTGVPQSHISKIETGGVDLRVSTLIELSHGLGRELAIISLAAMPAVRAMSDGRKASDKPSKAAYSLDDDFT